MLLLEVEMSWRLLDPFKYFISMRAYGCTALVSGAGPGVQSAALETNLNFSLRSVL